MADVAIRAEARALARVAAQPIPHGDASVPHASAALPAWARMLWITAGMLALLLGLVGIVMPLLPTVPFVLLAALCFSRGSERCERWLLAHPRLGPLIVDWRATRAVPLRAKQLATLMMSISSVWAWFVLPGHWRWTPAVCCALVAVWLWRLPTRPTRLHP